MLEKQQKHLSSCIPINTPTGVKRKAKVQESEPDIDVTLVHPVKPPNGKKARVRRTKEILKPWNRLWYLGINFFATCYICQEVVCNMNIIYVDCDDEFLEDYQEVPETSICFTCAVEDCSTAHIDIRGSLNIQKMIAINNLPENRAIRIAMPNCKHNHTIKRRLTDRDIGYESNQNSHQTKDNSNNNNDNKNSNITLSSYLSTNNFDCVYDDPKISYIDHDTSQDFELSQDANHIELMTSKNLFQVNPLQSTKTSSQDFLFKNTKPANILLLGMSYTSLNKESYNIPCILSLLKQKKITKMNARDLVRILEIETSFNKLCYTVSLVQSIERFSERHLSVSFSSRNFMESLITQFGLGCQFEQIILDYFWIPTGIWQKEHWTKAFFNKTLVEFATKDILITHGVIYLPFTVHCLHEIAMEYDILNKLYQIGWVDKTNLDKNILWKATNKIDANIMFASFEKQLNQEEIYCKISKQMLGEDLSQKDNIYRDLMSNVADIENIRFISLSIRSNTKKFLDTCYTIDTPLVTKFSNQTYDTAICVNAVQLKDSDIRSPLLPPDEFYDENELYSLTEIKDARSFYNELIQYCHDSKFKHRKYLKGSKHIHMFGFEYVNIIDWNNTFDMDIKVKVEFDNTNSYINIRKAPTSLSEKILLLHKRLTNIKGNCRINKDGDSGEMHALGTKIIYKKGKIVNDEYKICKENSDIQTMMYEIGNERKQWFISCFPSLYTKYFDKDISLPYMSNSLSDMMVHSISLGNASHYDVYDNSITVTTWVEDTINNTENWYLVFPNVTSDNCKATIIKLFHGCTVCWDASKLRHASSVPSYRIKGGGISSGNCELRKKKNNRTQL